MTALDKTLVNYALTVKIAHPVQLDRKYMTTEQWRQDAQSLQTARDFVRFSATQMNKHGVYFGHGTDNAWDEALFMVMETLHLPWALVEQVLPCRLTDSERDALVELLQQRIEQRMPAAYLLGRAWFCGLPFVVNEHVLVPRSPIAELIEQQFAPWLGQTPEKILDLCTGSGCIGIACALAFPEAVVDLSDISPEAIDVAWQNIDLHDLEHRVQAKESDLFSALAGEQYDLIVCNPPYVDAEDIASMPDEYHHEPQLGLASGDDGLNFTRRLLAEAPQYLTENGLLVCEVGNSCEALEAAFPDTAFTWVEFERGGHGVFVLTARELAAINAGMN